MDSARWIVDLLTSPATPLYGMLLIVGVMAWRVSVQGLPAIMLAFVERRRVTAAEKAADWDRLRDEVKRQGDEIREVRANEQDCQRKLNDALRRLATIEGFQVGRGEGHNEAQVILSAERQADAKKAKPDG
jgi:hypothetical protein